MPPDPDAYQRVRARRARLLLAFLLAVVLTLCFLAPWHTPWAVDERTYFEMIDGISRYGLPYSYNGDAARFPELRSRWNVLQGGRLWGKYPPLFPYLAVPFYRLGGCAAVIKANILALALLVFGVFLLGRRLGGDPQFGAICAGAALLATPAGTMAMQISPYPLVAAILAWATYLAAVALDTAAQRSVLWATAAGGVAGLGCATHLLAVPAVIGLAAGLVLLGEPTGGRWTDRPPHEPAVLAAPSLFPSRWPCRWPLLRGIGVLAGAALPLAGMAVLNSLRFGSVNPFTYGPCPWKVCTPQLPPGAEQQSLLSFSLPLVIWVGLCLAAGWLLRGNRRYLLLLTALCVTGLLLVTPLRQRTLECTLVTGAFLVDVGMLGIEQGSRCYYRTSDGLGVLFGPHAVKAVLQGMPAVSLALLPILLPGDGRTSAGRQRERRIALLIALVVVAVLVTVVLRGGADRGAHKLGFPFINIRYLMPTAPLLMILAVLAVRGLAWRRTDVVVGALTAVALGIVFGCEPDDLGLARRVLLLRVSLLLAVFSCVSAAACRLLADRRWLSRAAAVVVAVTFAFTAAVTIAVDYRATAREVSKKDNHVDHLAGLLPDRLALIGYPQEIDSVISLREHRDLEYGDLSEGLGGGSLRHLLLTWYRQRRPVFLVLPAQQEPPRSMAGLRVTAVDRVSGLYALDLGRALEPQPRRPAVRIRRRPTPSGGDG